MGCDHPTRWPKLLHQKKLTVSHPPIAQHQAPKTPSARRAPVAERNADRAAGCCHRAEAHNRLTIGELQGKKIVKLAELLEIRQAYDRRIDRGALWNRRRSKAPLCQYARRSISGKAL